MIQQILAREIANGMWCILSGFFALVCAVWLVSEIRKDGWEYGLEARIAVALGLCFFGASIRAGWLWLLWVYQNNGWDTHWIEQLYALVLVGTAIAVAGGLCGIRVFSSEWGHWVWIVAGLASTVVPIWVHIYF